MTHYTQEELVDLGFAALGREVLISRDARIYRPERIEIGDFSRIDDFCVLSGRLSIGRNVHLAPGTQLAAGAAKIVMDDFSGCAFNVVITASSDDYSGESLTNPTVPEKWKPKKIIGEIHIGRHVLIGTGSIILPHTHIEEGTAIGALSLVKGNIPPWSIWAGNPLRQIGERAKTLLSLEHDYINYVAE